MKSLDQIESEQFGIRFRPLDGEAAPVKLRPGAAESPPALEPVSLDGTWQLAEGGDRLARVAGDFADAIPAEVPGSIHLALERAGVIPDPKVGKNDAIARGKSFADWYYCTRFARPAGMANPRLVFEGVANKFGVFLNGIYMGDHGGMFGAWEVPLGDALRDENLLVVRVLPAPYEAAPDDYFPGANNGWQHTVTINNVYGWHYSNIPCLGIWRSVRLEETPAIGMATPFLATRDLAAGEVDFRAEFQAVEDWRGTLTVTIEPENFQGAPFHFTQEISGEAGASAVRRRFAIPEARLWWPNGLGDPHLYQVIASFLPDGAERGIVRRTTFGLRTIEMAPLPEGPREDLYNWTFVINGQPMFVKGTGWCTMDSSLDFRRERYERFLGLARNQHCQMVRAWGSGMPETDDFYDLCDRYGLMVMQEWPTAWNSQKLQPYRQLEETVRHNTLRLRNHPSLVMWGGGNESMDVEDPIIDMMGRLAAELDGTRPFHRGEPRGGSDHNYGCWWEKKPLDHNVAMEARFWGEFGIASAPVPESVRRYLPAGERDQWPPAEDGSFAHHTPVFNGKEDLVRLRLYTHTFSAGKTLEEFVTASQVAQATALRHTLERSRTRWPRCTGALYYKLNDNYPAVSWAVADWYGAAKIAHYICQDAFAPVHACLLTPKLDLRNHAAALPVYLLDDAGALADADWLVEVRAFGGELTPIHDARFSGRGAGTVQQIGEFTLTAEQTRHVPLLLTVDWRSGDSTGRTFYWLNYEARQGCLFQLPPTELALSLLDEGRVRLRNVGAVPAVGAEVSRPGRLDTFSISDNCLWLNPGEEIQLRVSHTDGLFASAWNCAR